MAGAGPNVERLSMVVVPPMLSEGGRFLKWDDGGKGSVDGWDTGDIACYLERLREGKNLAQQDISLHVSYILEVDPKGHVLYWKPEDYSKETEVLDLVHIRDVRTGQYAKVPKSTDVRAREIIRTFCAFEHEASNIQERTITLCHGPNLVDVAFVNFVASSISEADEWTKALSSCINNLLEINTSPLKSLERFYTRIYVQKNQDGEVPARLLVKHLVSSKEDKKRAYETLQSVCLASGKKDAIKVKDFTFKKFLEFYNTLCTRHDIDGVFAELGAKKRPYLSIEQLVDFLNNRQRDPRLNEILYPYYNSDRAMNIIRSYEPNKDFANKGQISIEGLTKFLMSSDNPILMPELINIHQDMTFPLPHYFVSSSHNTYLTGHQFTGRSSVEIYRQVLLAGCRCIELDCWDGRTEDQEPIITHGISLCSEILFKDALEAIHESAFKTTDYPVILSFENHCSAKQQKKMANYCLQIFGDSLVNKSLDDYPLEPRVQLPSPSMFKRKILIKNKKRPPKVSGDSKYTSYAELTNQMSTESSTSVVQLEVSLLDDLPEEENVKEIVPKSEEEEQPEVEAQQELSDIVNYFQPVHFRGFDKAEKLKKYYEMSSFSENAAMNLLKETPVEFVNYNKFQNSRIYPKGSRVSSDNFLPQLFWNAGCQLVALNFQTLDIPMMLNLAKFEINGRCGYLLKPEHMRRSDRTFDPFVESTVDGIIAGTVQIKVISGQCLSERKCSTYVEVEMYGLPADTVRRKFKTKTVSNNGLNPVYDEEPFKFKVILPQLAELRIVVYEEGGKFIGHRVLPVTGLSAGYRHIKLRNESYQPLALPTLFVDIVTKDFVPESFSDFADALANPMKYLSEKEKRTQQLEALMIDEQEQNEPEKMNGLPTPEQLAMKRESIVVLPGLTNTIDKKDNRKDKKDSGSLKEKPSGRVNPVQATKSNPEERRPSQQSRSQSLALDDTIDVEFLMAPPTLELLMEHKVFLKLKQHHDTEMNALTQRQNKERMKMNKDLETDTKRVKALVEKDKSALQKKHAKILKKSEKEGTHTEAYNECLKEINELNARHENQIQSLERDQRQKMKDHYITYYQEQLNLAKAHVQPKIAELRKVLQLIEIRDKKKQDEIHAKNISTLKRNQEKYSRSEIKELSKKFKDKAELQKERRAHNKKHIEQSVKEIKKLEEFQEKQREGLSKQYEEVLRLLDTKHESDEKELDALFKEKCALLDTESITNLSPILLCNLDISLKSSKVNLNSTIN